jgi:uroporphyrinogen-III synthase
MGWMESTSLLGAVVGITADRRREEQAMLLQRHGARVVHGPVIRTVPLADDQRLKRATKKLIAQPPDVVLLATAIGTRGWFSAADAQGLGDALHQALHGVDVAARGPKALGAAIAHGLTVTMRAESERSSEMVAHVAAAYPAGVRVAVQLDGDGGSSLPDSLRAIGADVVEVPVYRWTLPVDPLPGQRLVEAVAERRLDAVTFTSSPAVTNFLRVADSLDDLDRVHEALAGPVVAACVGPVCAETAMEAGLTRLVVPERARLGPLVQALTNRLATPDVLHVAGTEIVLRRSAVVIDGEIVDLSGREREVLEVLASRPTAVVSKGELLRRVWGTPDADEHTVEVTVARLRRRLGPAGKAVQTITRRGYRLVTETTPH